MDFDYVTPVNTGKYVTLSATSDSVTYNVHSTHDAPNIQWSTRYKPYKYGDGGGAVQEWLLDQPPLHGTLYEAGSVLVSQAQISDPDDLFYVPDANFTGTDRFSYCVNDASGQSNVAWVSVRVSPTSNYPMPVGVPHPGFGIDEQPPADPPEWPGAERTGYYYVDADHPQCDDGNAYGHPDRPRCSFPSSGATIAAGGKMVIRAASSPYTLRNSSWHQINSSGVAGNPSWILGDDRGPEKPVITLNPARGRTALRLAGSYLRLSGLVFDKVTLDHRGGGANQVVVRHSEFKNNPASGPGGTTVGLSTEGTGVLVFNVYAHDNGVVEAEGLTEERDIHAFVGSNQTGYWILDSRCDENAGDCVQLTNNNTTSNVYVGRLVSHSEGENCVDIKDFNRVVVSESSCWDLRRVVYGNSGGNSQNFYVNDEGVQQNYVYFLNNRAWDTGGASYGASNIDGRVYFIGNLSFASPAANGFYSGAGGGSRYVFFNTFADSATGIYHYGSGSAQDRYMVGNLIDGASQYQTRIAGDTSVINMLDFNQYVQDGMFAHGSNSTPTEDNGLVVFAAATGFEQNGNSAIDPGYVAPDTHRYQIGYSSQARDVVSEILVNSLPFVADLLSDLGVTPVDASGVSRPQGGIWDAGAFEVVEVMFADGFE